MKRWITSLAAILILAGCAQQEPAEPIVEAGPETGVGSGTAASSGVGTATAQGAAINESENAATNKPVPVQPPLPPEPK